MISGRIVKRLPKAPPKPTAHIIDWFHIAKKIRPLQQMADHIVRTSAGRNNRAILVDDDIRSVIWKLWREQTDRAIDRLEKIMTELAVQSDYADASAKRLLDLAQPLLTYVRSNRNAIVDYAHATDPAVGLLRHSPNPPSIPLSRGAWSKSSKCNGRSSARTACCKFARPSSTATRANAWLGNLQSRHNHIASPGCSSQTAIAESRVKPS